MKKEEGVGSGKAKGLGKGKPKETSKVKQETRCACSRTSFCGRREEQQGVVRERNKKEENGQSRESKHFKETERFNGQWQNE